MARVHTEEMLDILLEIARDDEEEASDRIKAAKEVLSRGWGQAKQTIDVQGTIQQQHLVATINVGALSMETAKQLLDATITQPAIEGEITGEGGQ